jgi:hypothetical protein
MRMGMNMDSSCEGAFVVEQALHGDICFQNMMKNLNCHSERSFFLGVFITWTKNKIGL